MVKKIQIKYVITFLALFLFLLFIGSGNVVSPFYGDLNLIDEGQYLAWIGHMRAGDLLYKDTYAAYGPLLIYPYYLVSKIFEPTFFTLRIFYGVFGMLLSISVVFLILNKLRVTFPFQVFCAFMLCFIPGFGVRQASGLFAIFLSYLAFNKNGYIWSFLAGVSISLSFLISSDMGIFSVAVVAMTSFIVFLNTEDFRTYFKKIGIIILGSISLFLVFYLFTSIEGWFSFYASSVLDDFVSYSGIGIPVGRSFPNAIDLMPSEISFPAFIKYFLSKEILFYWIFIIYILSLIYFFIKFMLKKINEADKFAFYIIVYGLLISTTLIGRLGFNYVVTLVSISLVFFLNLLIINKNKKMLPFDKLVSVLIIGIILIFIIRLISIYRVHLYKIPHSVNANFMQKNNPVRVGNVLILESQKKDVEFIQEFINKNTDFSEKIFFLSNNPGMYLLVNRVSPSKFDLPEVANTKEKRLEIINDLEKDQTEYVIDYVNAYEVEGISNRIRLPEVMKYLNENYSTSRQGNFIIYTRNN